MLCESSGEPFAQAADEPEKTRLWGRAMLGPKVYRELFNTYQGDQTSKAKIRGRVQQLGVHPDLSETCADLFVASALTSALATADGDGIRLTSAVDVVQPVQAETPEAEGSDTGERVEAGPLDSDVAAGM